MWNRKCFRIFGVLRDKPTQRKNARKMDNFIEAMKTEIDKFDPCSDGLDFRKKFKTFEEAWNACERGDWMLWIAAKLKVDIRILTLAKGLCANTVKHLMKDNRSTAAVDAAIAFGNGEIDENELETAARSARAANGVYAYAHVAAAYAHAAAAHAAYVSVSAAYVSVSAAHVSASSTFNADTDTYKAAKKQNEKQTADICREVLTDEVLRLISEL